MSTRVHHSITKSIERARAAVAKELDIPLEHVEITAPMSTDPGWCIVNFRAGIQMPPEHCYTE